MNLELKNSKFNVGNRSKDLNKIYWMKGGALRSGLTN